MKDWKVLYVEKIPQKKKENTLICLLSKTEPSTDLVMLVVISDWQPVLH